jgi:hypothetical protein
VEPAREKGVIPSFLQPLDKPFPMVSLPRTLGVLRRAFFGKRGAGVESSNSKDRDA